MDNMNIVLTPRGNGKTECTLNKLYGKVPTIENNFEILGIKEKQVFIYNNSGMKLILELTKRTMKYNPKLKYIVVCHDCSSLTSEDKWCIDLTIQGEMDD